MTKVLSILKYVDNMSVELDKLDQKYSEDAEGNLTSYIAVLEFVIRTATSKLNGAKALRDLKQRNNEGLEQREGS